MITVKSMADEQLPNMNIVWLAFRNNNDQLSVIRSLEI